MEIHGYLMIVGSPAMHYEFGVHVLYCNRSVQVFVVDAMVI